MTSGSNIFFHGSMEYLPVGTVLMPRGEAYEADWKNADFYSVLEKYRPADKLAHKNSVFVCRNDEDVDLAGGGTIWMFRVKPITPVEWHDMEFSTLISCLISDGHAVDAPKVVEAARNYWVGEPVPNDSIWEGLCSAAEIVAVEEY